MQAIRSMVMPLSILDGKALPPKHTDERARKPAYCHNKDMSFKAFGILEQCDDLLHFS